MGDALHGVIVLRPVLEEVEIEVKVLRKTGNKYEDLSGGPQQVSK